MDGQMDQPENTTLAATAPTSSNSRPVGGGEEVDPGRRMLYSRSLGTVTCHSGIYLSIFNLP